MVNSIAVSVGIAQSSILLIFDNKRGEVLNEMKRNANLIITEI